MIESKARTAALAGDEQAIHSTVMAVEESWNQHDMDAFAALLTPEVEWVNPAGMWWRGRADVKRAHQAYHDTFFKTTSRHATAITIQHLAPDVAIVTATYRMGDWVRPDDGRLITNSQDRVTYVLVQQEGRWWICRGHVTDIDLNAAPFDPINQGAPS